MIDDSIRYSEPETPFDNEFVKELEALLHKHKINERFMTPSYILSEYVHRMLVAYYISMMDKAYYQESEYYAKNDILPPADYGEVFVP